MIYVRTIYRPPLKWEHCAHVVCFCLTLLVSATGFRSDASGESIDFTAATLKAEAREALRSYLNLDCSVAPLRQNSTPGAFERLMQISTDAPEIEATLISLLQSRPEKDDRAAIIRTLEAEWSELKSFLDQKPELGLQSEDLRMLQQVMDNKETYIERGLDRIQRQYQERSAIAVIELANRGSATSKKALTEIMNTGNAASKAAISQAQKRLAPQAGVRQRH